MMLKKKRTYFYSYIYAGENGEYALGHGYIKTKSVEKYIYLEIKEYLEDRYPNVEIISLSRIY